MGDKLNEYNGGLEFEHTDVSLPGNNALPVMVGRRLATGTRQAALNAGLFGDWDLSIPHLHTLSGAQATDTWFGRAADGTGTLQRCNQFQVPPPLTSTAQGQTQLIYPANWWDGYHMSIPGMGEQTLLRRNTFDAIQPASGGPYPVLTKDNWQFSCLTTLANGTGEGFVAHAPDGSLYQFDHIATRAYLNYQPVKTDGTVAAAPRNEIWIMPSQLTDRFGNWVRYTYDASDAWKLLSISSSDGRVISFTYVSGTHRIQTVFDGTRTWTYGYSGTGTLQSVVLPDGSSWSFALQPLEHTPVYAADPICDGGFSNFVDQNTYSGTIVHPSGATGTFSHKLVWHGTANVPGSLDGCNGAGYVVNGITFYNQIPTYSATYSLLSKTLSGPGMPGMTWFYDYGTPNGSFAPTTGNVVTTTVTITDPLNNVVQNTYGTQYGVNAGLLLASSTRGPSSGTLQTTSYAYNPSNAGPYPSSVGDGYSFGDVMSRIYTPQSQRVINQQGVNFTQTVTGFDIYARPTGVSKSSSLGYGKTEATTYYDDTNLWVLGQVSATTTNGIQSSSTSFYPSTALPSATYSFGKLQASYAFNGDGTLSSLTDGLNHTTSFANYVRGLPQRITYADGSVISAVVNSIGTLNSVTNEAGTSWSFGYDAMGRLARKTPPGGYNPTTLSFVQVPNDEYGIEANHWRQTITTGNAVTINVFDARWRKRVSLTYDAGDPANTQRMQRFKYDPYNRTTSASYPARSLPSIDSYTGTSTVYDALGRVTATVSDSELGNLSTNTAYLSGFLKRYADAKGNVTTTAFQAFDEPDESAIASVAAPEGLNVAIDRDVFGKPLAITRTGPGVSATRRYVYDSNQLLCKTLEPEIGATIQALDAANNVSWRATGLNLPNIGSCDHASVPGARIVGFTYDARNRLTGTGFGDGSPAIGRSYTPDGLPWTVVSNGSTWTYGYDPRRLLTSERLAYGDTYTIGRSYDGNANLSQLTYPDNATVDFAPNALGEATRAGSYATSVGYHPNGQVASYTLGNGTVHTLTQNVRGLPLVNRDAGVLQDQYAYDANGNIASIADQQEGIGSRSMAYDGLDRLTAANAPAVWGAASYSYDALGNLRTSAVGSRSSVHAYVNNRLDTITTNGAVTAYIYDSQGNITARGTQGFYFDQGNRLQLANGVTGYTYDGLGRRVSISANDGSTRTQVYSQAGQLLYGTKQSGMLAGSTRYVYLGGKAIAEVNSSTGTPTYLHTDALGSVVATVGQVPATLSYSCPAGWTLSGTTCTQASSSTIAATLTGYSCPAGYTLSGSSCSQTTTSTSAATATYTCPAGWSLSGSTCTSTSSSAATPVYSCPSGYTLSGTTCSGTATAPASSTLNCNGHGSLQPYAGSPTGYKCLTQGVNTKLFDDPYGQCQSIAASMGLPLVGTSVSGSTMTCVIGPLQVYSCPAGATLSGSTCTSTVTQAASIGSYTCSSGTLSGSSCVVTSTSAASVSYSCPAGQTLSGTSCISASTSSVAGTPIYGCPAGYTLAGSSCTTQGTASIAAMASYSCASGTLSGTSCSGAVRRTRYEAYGNTAAGTVPAGLGFTGHVNDADTGLVYMQQRYYDPIAARFLSTDPVTTNANTGGTFNRYEYANNNPYRYVDPDGRDSIEDETHLGGRGAAEPFGVPRGIDGGPVRQSIEASRATLQQMRTDVTARQLRQEGRSEFSKSREAALQENNGACNYCGTRPATQGDHVKSLKSYADDVNQGKMTKDEAIKESSARSNVLGSCGSCNGAKGAKELGSGDGKFAPSNPSEAAKQQSSNGGGFKGVFQVGGRIDSARLGKQLNQ